MTSKNIDVYTLIEPEICKLIQKCWNDNPLERPNVRELVNEMNEIVNINRKRENL